MASPTPRPEHARKHQPRKREAREKDAHTKGEGARWAVELQRRG